MADQHEQAFAEEAFEEAQEESYQSQIESHNLETSSSNPKVSVQADVIEAVSPSGESSPLLGSGDGTRGRRNYTRAGASYERAINEPWLGAYGKGKLPWYKTPSIFWLLPAFFPFCLAFGGILVPRTYLILDLICKDYLSERSAKDPTFVHMPILIGGNNNDQCRIPEVQSLVSYFNTYSNLLSGVFSALVAPFFGLLSDRIGRKKVIVISSMGSFMGEIITIIVGRNPDKLSVYWLLLGSLIDGLCGSFTTGLALASAYAADCSAPEKRAVAFGYFHATLFSGIALGPILSGYVIKATGNMLLPFYIALGCHLFFISTVAFVIPESLSQERQEIAREKHAKAMADWSGLSWFETIKKYNPLEPLWVLRPTGEGATSALRRNLLVLATIDTMMFGVAMGTMQILLIYAQYRFGWDTFVSSIYTSTTNIVRVTGLLLILPLLTKLFGSKTQARGHRGSNRVELNIIRISILFDLLGYLGYALAPTGTFMFLSGITAAIGGIGSPTLSSSITKHIPVHMTGQVLGASALLHALARIVAPVVFNIIYAETVKKYAGFVFLCLASIFVVVFVLSWFLKPGIFLQDQFTMEEEVQESHTEELSK